MQTLPLLPSLCCGPGTPVLDPAERDALELSQPTVSHHLRLLREALGA